MKKKKANFSIDSSWLDYANEDYNVIEMLIKSQDTFYRTICFHAQQYVEKILKGLLENLKEIPPKSHDIQLLCRLVEQKGFTVPLTKEEIVFLKSVYIESRYPSNIGLLPQGEPTKTDAQFAYKIIKKINKWVDTEKE